mmetsp:Transcript_17529/g.40590  ORF Transcript_17529/g.40590 Transcript_17529/m.40590 type:complete len:192 (+) Transcript_17529:79-654(+)
MLSRCPGIILLACLPVHAASLGIARFAVQASRDRARQIAVNADGSGSLEWLVESTTEAPAPAPAPMEESSLDHSASNFANFEVPNVTTTYTESPCPCALGTTLPPPYLQAFNGTVGNATASLDINPAVAAADLPEDQDCVLTAWSEWSICMNVPFDNLRQNFRFRSRYIELPTRGSGKHCEPLQDQQSCSR